jgi:hypothetical protein
MMPYEDLLTRVIDEGIEAARVDYGKREDKPEMLRGAIDGFEACRGKSPLELAALWQHAERQGHFTRSRETTMGDAQTFWYWRCYASELEWVANVLSVGLVQKGLPPILPWLPTARGTLKYAEIVGVEEITAS